MEKRIKNKVIECLKTMVDESKTNLKLKDLTAKQRGGIGILNICQTIYIYGKTNKARRILLDFYDGGDYVDMTKYTVGLNKRIDNKDKKEYNAQVDVDIYFLNDVIKLFRAMEENVKITAKTGFPLKIENKHFVAFVAPIKKRGD